MPLFRRHLLFVPLDDGSYAVKLSQEARHGIVTLAQQLDDLLDTDLPETRRLFPTAYPEDPERDAGYQVFARQQLIDKRRDAVELIRSTASKDRLTEDELSAWMGVLNDLRLVLGTMLDVSEDDYDIDSDDPNIDSHMLYRYLGELVHNIVEALTTSLPDPEDESTP